MYFFFDLVNIFSCLVWNFLVLGNNFNCSVQCFPWFVELFLRFCVFFSKCLVYFILYIGNWIVLYNLLNKSFSRLAFSRFFDIRGISEMLKKNRLEKLISPVKWSAWLHASTLQNFARRHFFDVNGVSIVILWERDVETGENMWKVLKTKAWA